MDMTYFAFLAPKSLENVSGNLDKCFSQHALQTGLWCLSPDWPKARPLTQVHELPLTPKTGHPQINIT